jgi:predicted nuclease with TOPRIM domain
MEALKRVNEEVNKLKKRVEELESTPIQLDIKLINRSLQALADANKEVTIKYSSAIERITQYESAAAQMTVQLAGLTQELNILKSRIN